MIRPSLLARLFANVAPRNTTRRRKPHRLVKLEPLEDRALLTAYVVNTADDVVGVDGVISLREAIEASNTNAASGDAAAGMADGDSITFAASLNGSTILLALGELSITEDLAINGQNRHITVDADNASRVFNIDTDETVRLANLTLTGGAVADSGGAIAAAGGGVTQLHRMRITGNTASGDGGGALFVDSSTLNVTQSAITENEADGASGSGGGILASGGEVYVFASRIVDNTANRAGGGVEVVDSEVSIVFSALAENTAGPIGLAAPGNGGGLHVTGPDSTVNVLSSLVHGNTAASEGGGLWNDAGSTMNVVASAITRNEAQGTDPGDGGGGIFNNGGVLDIVFSTISGNTAAGDGGGLFLGDGGDVHITLSRIARNEAGGNGGGIYNNAALQVVFSSIAHNTATGDGGGIYTDTLGVTDLVFALLFGNSPNNLAGPGAVI